MNIKIFTKNLQIHIDKDLPRVQDWFKRHLNLVVSFTSVQETSIEKQDTGHALFPQNDGTCDMCVYMFDRHEYPGNSLCFQHSNTLVACWFATDIYDDGVDFTWKSLTHEIIHAIFYKLNKHLIDPMDAYIRNGVQVHYFNNEQPENPDSNFGEAIRRLTPYMPLFATTSPVASTLPSVTITRQPSDIHETLGLLTATNGNATFSCKTLELPWLNNAKNISCIPTGTYTVKKVFWTRKMGWFYQVQNVLGRSGIFIHEGNYYRNYEGCIGLGSGNADIDHDGEIDITNTVATVKAFMGFMGGKDFILTIK